MIDDEKPQPLPDKYRASTDEKDEAAFARLLANDQQQKELGERVNSPFTAASPRDMARSKAFVTINTLVNAGKLTPDSREILAEAYATTGQYNIAAKVSKLHKALYRKYWKAVWLDDDKWCDHDERHKFVKEYVYSQRESREMPMLACNVCDTWNVLDAPERLTKQHQRENDTRAAAPTGLPIGDLLAWHKRQFGRA